MTEHRWTIPCKLSPDEAQRELAGPLEHLQREGFELIEHVETVGFFGWTVRAPDGRAAGVSVPQPGGPSQVLVRSEHPELANVVVDALTHEGPLAGRDPEKKD